MDWNKPFQLEGGWGWLVITVVVAWLAPFFTVPRQYIQELGEKFESWWYRKCRNSFRIDGFSIEPSKRRPTEINIHIRFELKNRVSVKNSIKNLFVRVDGKNVHGSLSNVYEGSGIPFEFTGNELRSLRYVTEEIVMQDKNFEVEFCFEDRYSRKYPQSMMCKGRI